MVPFQRPSDDDACVTFGIRSGVQTLHLEHVLVEPFAVLPVLLGKNPLLHVLFQPTDALGHDVIKALLRKVLQVELAVEPAIRDDRDFPQSGIYLVLPDDLQQGLDLRRVTAEQLIVKRDAVGVNEQSHHHLHLIRAVLLGHPARAKFVGIKTLEVKRGAVVKRDSHRSLVDIRDPLVDVTYQDIPAPAQEPESFVKVRLGEGREIEDKVPAVFVRPFF